ncbi:MAG: Mur ligase family protein [Candidatus Poribacteria bacterium]|nr:Mur ligase family protein [Candidatus Poribacteria bacterium]
MTYDDARQFFDTLMNYEAQPLNARLPRFFNLRRMEALMERLGNPHIGLRIVHAAGTKGKGSICSFAANILRAAGLNVCLYTQPHLVSPRERFQQNGRCVSKELFADLTAQVRPAVEAQRDSEFGVITFFEAYTALFFLFARENEADAAVVETGLGGRLDATNICDPVLSVIAPIGFDHMRELGDALEEIAREKAGIVKPSRPVVSSRQLPRAESVLREEAERQGAPFISAFEEIQMERKGVQNGLEACSLKWRDGALEGLRLRMLGAHQVENAAAAVAAALALRREGWQIPLEAMRRGLEETRLHGRFQTAQALDGRTLVLDAAHTPESAAALSCLLRELYSDRRVGLMVGMAADKDAAAFARALSPAVSHVVLTRASGVGRAASPSALAEAWRGSHASVSARSSLKEAFEHAQGDVLCVTGSVYLVGEALRTLAPSSYQTFCEEARL